MSAIPEQATAHNANRHMVIALTVYVGAVAGLIALFTLDARVADWVSQSAQAEFANEQLIQPETGIVTAKLGNVAYP
jgi:hypothetical protein